MGNLIKLYGVAISYYTGKARSYLQYKEIDFEEIASSAEMYRDVIIPKTGVRYIPIVVTGEGVAIQDTTDIIDYFEEKHPSRSVYPEGPRQKLVSLLLEVYGDEWLKLPAMHYRWAYNYDFIVEEFGKNAAPNASREEQRASATDRVAYFSGSRVHLGITEKTAPAIEAWYESFLADFDAHLANHEFLLGGRPSIGDFGLYGPLYAHLYRDPYSGAFMKRLAPRVARWVERMTDLKSYTDQNPNGAFLENDEIPATLSPILRRLFAEHFPVMADTVKKVGEWAQSNHGQELPRALGPHTFTIGGVSGERQIFPYVQWMLQRPLDHYQESSAEARQSLDVYLAEVGGVALSELTLACRLVRRENKLFAA